MNEIIPNLYLSSFTNAQLYPDIKNCYIVNCTKNLDMLSKTGIRLSVDDDMNTKNLDIMFESLILLTDKIHEQIKNNNTVVVHCLAGQQRSATVIAAYLMRYKKLTLIDSIKFTRNKRNEAFFWQVNFRDSLERFSYII